MLWCEAVYKLDFLLFDRFNIFLKETLPNVATDEGENDRISKEELFEVSKAIDELSEASPLSTEKEILQELKEDREEYKEVNDCTRMCVCILAIIVQVAVNVYE